MWLLKLHLAFSILLWLTYMGFAVVFREQRIKNGYTERTNIFKRFVQYIRAFILCLFPIMNIMVVLITIVISIYNKERLQDVLGIKIDESNHIKV